MAILKNGINGAFSGKVGSVYGYERFGQACIRGARKPSAKNKEGSVKQQLSRSKFNRAQEFLTHILHFVRIGFNIESKKRQMTAHNLAKSYLLTIGFDEDGLMDCSKVLVSAGTLMGAANPVVLVSDEGFHVRWDTEGYEVWERNSDQVMLLAYIPGTAYQETITSGAKWKMGKETLAMDASWLGKSFHIWMAFIAEDSQNISTSQYLGEHRFGTAY
ncbi:hypothetical protein ACVWYG_000422 [Pedobacter sp. UYEF25]